MTAIAVDFDGVIHQYSQGWQDGSIYDPPMMGAEDGLRLLMERFAVFIHTTRNTNDVAKWVTEKLHIPTQTYTCEYVPMFWNERDAILVTNHKLPAVAYIDDRAHKFTNWNLIIAAFTTPEKSTGIGD